MEIPFIFFIAGIIFVLCFFGYVAYFLLSLFGKKVYGDLEAFGIIPKERINGKTKLRLEQYFAGKFSYYDKLPDERKNKFLYRVNKFLNEKTFVGRNDLEVTEEMQARIAGAAVQLTFGLKEYLLDHFEKIIVFPESYFSKITGKFHMGEANPAGVIVLSWKDFTKGFAIPNDKYNVGLHEMAHALELEKRLGGNSDSNFNFYYKQWISVTENEFQNLQTDEPNFLREYAGTNRREFFAVCVEYFFEASEDFKSNLPEIYKCLSLMLNQDPLKRISKLAD